MFVLYCDTYRRRRHNKTLKSDNNKQQKRKKQNEKETQTKESSKASCQPRMSAYLSLGATPPPPLPPRFSCVSCESNTLQSPQSELRALVPRSLTHSLLEICGKTRFEASRVVFWSLSCYKELRLTTNRFTGRTLHGLIQMQNISL